MRSLWALPLIALVAAASGLPVGAAGTVPHEARDLEATLPVEALGPTYRTSSLIAEAAAREWDQDYLLRYILAGTCRNRDDFQMAVLEGYDPSVLDEMPDVDPWATRDIAARALRFAGADGARLRESYLQAMRFGGPPGEDVVVGPYGGFVAAPGWRRHHPRHMVILKPRNRQLASYSSSSTGRNSKVSAMESQRSSGGHSPTQYTMKMGSASMK
jgi:hypothetical protein